MHLYSADAVKFFGCVPHCGTPVALNYLTRGIHRLKKFQPVIYDPVQLRWWINMMYACAATPGILLVDNLTCELQVTLAAFADAKKYQRLVIGAHSESPHIRFASTKGMIPEQVRDQIVVTIGDAMKLL